MTRQIFELHSFTVEGGLQFEKDVRTIGVGFANLTPDRIPTYKGDVCRHCAPGLCSVNCGTCRCINVCGSHVILWWVQSVRSKLSRLGNIASIVAISSVEDLEDYDLLLSPTAPVNSHGTAKKLSQAEAVKLLKVRIRQTTENSPVCQSYIATVGTDLTIGWSWLWCRNVWTCQNRSYTS